MNINNKGITEETMTEMGILPLSAQEIENKIIGKTIKGDWGTIRKYVCYFDPSGSAEGINDLDTESVGKWSIDMANNTISFEWDSYWDTWSGRMYEMDGKILLFDEQSHQMRTLIHTIEDGRRGLKL